MASLFQTVHSHGAMGVGVVVAPRTAAAFQEGCVTVTLGAVPADKAIYAGCSRLAARYDEN